MVKATSASLQRNAYTLILFWIPFLLGIPLWWHTTSLYRAPLPYDTINSLPGQIAQSGLRNRINLKLPKDGSISFESLSRTLNDRYSSVEIRVSSLSATFDEVAKTVSTDNMKEFDKAIQDRKLGPTDASFSIFVLNSNKDRACIGAFRHAWIEYSGETLDGAWNSKLLRLIHEVVEVVTYNHQGEDTRKVDKRTTSSLSHGYHLSFSLLNAESSHSYTWNFGKLHDKLKPFLDDIHSVFELYVDSQIRYSVPLRPRKGTEEDQREKGNEAGAPTQEKGITVHIKELPYLLNSNEWDTSVSTSSIPTLHLVVYVPSALQTPFRIRSSEGTYSSTNAYVIHGSTGVIVLNKFDESGGASCDKNPYEMCDEKLQSIASLFVSQMRDLFGVSTSSFSYSSPIQVQMKTGSSVPLFMLPSSSGLAYWEKDNLHRRVAHEAYASAVQHLRSLGNVTQTQSNMEISDEVQQLVLATIDKVQATNKCTAPQESAKIALSAMRKANEAFFNPNLLPMLYFPEEFKYAVYLPFLFPIACGLLRETINFFKDRKALNA